ncbi:TASOR family protein [Chryseobacterium sp. PET-29]|uniref:TASOR family protein n=2 Tax=unclassified Chryseobacterium TaxID=2593645 RepID=UPI0021E56489|nr:TASOR family protein [Chryseobacterium sp. PET-29]
MSATLSTYRKFIYKDDALELIKILEVNHIDYELADNSSRLDSSFGADVNNQEFELKIQKENFNKVEELEEKLVENDVQNVERDYYLFEYSDEELIEIILKKEEWSKFDYLLAQKILKERGKEISPEVLTVISKQR